MTTESTELVAQVAFPTDKVKATIDVSRVLQLGTRKPTRPIGIEGVVKVARVVELQCAPVCAEGTAQSSITETVSSVPTEGNQLIRIHCETSIASAGEAYVAKFVSRASAGKQTGEALMTSNGGVVGCELGYNPSQIDCKTTIYWASNSSKSRKVIISTQDITGDSLQLEEAVAQLEKLIGMGLHWFFSYLFRCEVEQIRVTTSFLDQTDLMATYTFNEFMVQLSADHGGSVKAFLRSKVEKNAKDVRISFHLQELVK